MWEDPIVSEVRRIREQLAKQFNFDVHLTFMDLRQRQSLLGSKLTRRQRREKVESAPDSDVLHPGR